MSFTITPVPDLKGCAAEMNTRYSINAVQFCPAAGKDESSFVHATDGRGMVSVPVRSKGVARSMPLPLGAFDGKHEKIEVRKGCVQCGDKLLELPSVGTFPPAHDVLESCLAGDEIVWIGLDASRLAAIARGLGDSRVCIGVDPKRLNRVIRVASANGGTGVGMLMPVTVEPTIKSRWNTLVKAAMKNLKAHFARERSTSPRPGSARTRNSKASKRPKRATPARPSS